MKRQGGRFCGTPLVMQHFPAMRIRVDIGPFEDGEYDEVASVLLGVMGLTPPGVAVPVVAYISDEEPPMPVEEPAA